MSAEAWIVLIGALVGVSCATVGCFLVLRRQAMLGDAISHAVLPGIVLAFLLSGSLGMVPVILGAGAFGVLTVVVTDLMHRYGRVQPDAAIGVTFTAFFATGVILVSALAGQVHLDTEHILFGEILYAPFDTVTVLGAAVPRSALVMGTVTVINLVFLLLCYKQLKVCAFDPQLAASIGVNTVFWHYALMAAVSMTTVASFESVGAVIVVAMLVAPANTAYLLTDRLSAMIVLAALAGVVSAALGYALAALIDGSIAGAMATVSGALFALAALFGPRHGVVTRRWRLRRGDVRVPPMHGEAPGKPVTGPQG